MRIIWRIVKSSSKTIREIQVYMLSVDKLQSVNKGCLLRGLQTLCQMFTNNFELLRVEFSERRIGMLEVSASFLFYSTLGVISSY